METVGIVAPGRAGCVLLARIESDPLSLPGRRCIFPTRPIEPLARKTLQQGVQGDAVLLPGSGERCLGDSVKGPQLTSPFFPAAVGGMSWIPE